MGLRGTRGTVRVHINHSEISALFNPGMPVQTFTADFLRDVVTYSHATYRLLGISERSGVLINGTESGGVLKSGRYQARGSVVNNVRYAASVHDGTAGLAIRPHGAAMKVPKIRGTFGPGIPRFPVGPKFGKKFVKGQRAKPWIQSAMDTVYAQAAR